MIYIIGDIHFSASNNWKLNIGNNIVKWFQDRFVNCSNDTIIFLGDIVDNYINPGEITKQVTELFCHCSNNFKSVYILTGNHDVDYFKHRVDNFLRFVPLKFKNVKLIEDIDTAVIENISFLFMPHKMLETGTPLSKYYSNIDWEKQLVNSDIKEFDYALGHWVIYDNLSTSWINKQGVDTTNIPAKNVLCGHVHNRISSHYTGSVYACNPTEISDNRVMFKITSNSFEEEVLPKFVEYEDLYYPEMPKRQVGNKYLTRVYTIHNIFSEVEALQYYKNIFVKNVNLFQSSTCNTESGIPIESNNKLSMDAIINNFFETHDIEPEVLDIVKNLLSKTEEKNEL